MKGHRGFTLVRITIVVAMIGVMASIAVISFSKARETSQTTVCLDNLRRIEAAKKHWALANGKLRGDAVINEQVDTYIKGGAPSCPVDGIYTYGASWDRSNMLGARSRAPLQLPRASGALNGDGRCLTSPFFIERGRGLPRS